MDFTKYHASGNDYLIIDPRHTDLLPTGEIARCLCDRHFGIGADGVVFGPQPAIGSCQATGEADTVGAMMFNADGSPCGRSGNGIRILGLYLARISPSQTRFTVRTITGDCHVEIRDAAMGVVGIDMGRPSFDPDDVPVCGVSGDAIRQSLDLDTETITMTCLSVGTPHTVIMLEDLTAERACELGPKISSHPRFPLRTNVEFARVLDRETIEIEIWERGAGYTTASGAGSCAAASAARVQELAGDLVTVRMPGGDMEVAFSAGGSITLAGPVEQVVTGDFAPAFRQRLGMRAQ